MVPEAIDPAAKAVCSGSLRGAPERALSSDQRDKARSDSALVPALEPSAGHDLFEGWESSKVGND